MYNPPSSASRKPVLPMSLLALGAVLEGHHDYEIVDGNLEPDSYEAIINAFERTGAKVLAITVMPGPQLEHVVGLCPRIRASHPDIIIVWGGYFPTQHWEVSIKAPYVDYILRGHNELGLVALLDEIKAGNKPKTVPGLAYDHSLGAKTNPLPDVPHPDELPDYNYQKVDLNLYKRRTFMGQTTLSHNSSYGCPFFCNFCAVVNMVEGRWKAQSADRVAQVVHTLVQQHGADSVEFQDNNFFTSEKRVLSFSKQIEHLGISWWGEGRIDTMLKYKDETWAAMRDSGLRMVFLGAESGSDETLQRMDKGGSATTEKTLFIAEKMAKYNIVPEMSFVMGNPPNPERDCAQTIEFIRKVKRVNPKTEIIMYMYTPVPLSGELYDQAVADGFAFPDTLEEWVSEKWLDFSQRRSAELPWIKDPVRLAMKDFQSVLNAYYPTVTDVRFGRIPRTIIRTAAAWRYKSRFYRYPLELKVLHRLFPYQRPETSGF